MLLTVLLFDWLLLLKSVTVVEFGSQGMVLDLKMDSSSGTPQLALSYAGTVFLRLQCYWLAEYFD